MAIFFPPPPPFVGGSQPFAGHNGNVPAEAVPVNNPPPSHPGRTVAVMVAAALAWQPAPPDPFQGGSQPLAPRAQPASLLAVTVNNPPAGGAWYTEPPAQTIIAAWQPPPPDANFGVGQALTPRKQPPSLLAVRVDGPPLGGASYSEPPFQTVLTAWQPPPPDAFQGDRQPLAPRRLTPSLLNVQVDAPPFGGSAAQEPATLTAIAAWAPPDPNPNFGAGQPLQPRTLPASITAVPVNNPPGRVALQPWSLWQQDNVPQQQYAKVIITPSAFVGSTGAAQFETILSAWAAADPSPTVPRNLPASVMAVRVDSPPGAPQQPNLTNWQTPSATVVASLMAPGLLAPPSSQPLANVMPQAILVAWQPAASAPVMARSLPPSLLAVRVDNPPGLIPQPAMAAWQPIAPQPATPAGVAALVYVAAGQVPYEAVPFSVLNAWVPVDPLPTLPRALPAALTAVRVDAPPGLRAPLPASFWTPPDAPPQSTARLILSPPVVSPFLPGGNTTQIETILSAWQPAEFRAIAARPLPPVLLAVRVDNPPGLIQQPNAAPWQTQPLQNSAPVAIAPLFAAAGQAPYSPLPATVLAAWAPADPAPTLPPRLPASLMAVRVDPPPPRARVPQVEAWSWQPPAPNPHFGAGQPLQPRSLPAAVTNVAPAPFLPNTSRRHYEALVVRQWSAPDPLPFVARYSAAWILPPIPPVPGVPVITAPPAIQRTARPAFGDREVDAPQIDRTVTARPGNRTKKG